MKKICLTAIAVLFSMSVLTYAQLIGEFPEEGGLITISTTDGPIQAGGLDFQATVGSLSNGSNPEPWAFYLTGNDGVGKSQVTMGSLGNAPTLDGSLTLDVSATADAEIRATWGDGSVPRPFPMNGTLIDQPSQRPYISGSFPYGGGPVTISSGGIADQLNSIDIRATRGTLRTLGNAAPFESVTTMDPNRWIASSTNEITLDGSVTLDVTASADSTLGGLASNDAGSSNFSILALQTTDPIINAILPYSGVGPISIEPNNGPSTLRGLSVWSLSGVDLLSSGGSPAPFDELIDSSADVWSARSATDVVLDGRITLDVSTTSSQLNNLRLASIAADGSRANVPLSLAPNPGDRLTGSFPNGGGAITIASATQGEVVALRGIGIAATRGEISTGGNPLPFQSLFSPSPQEWSVVSNSDVLLDGQLTLDALATSNARLTGSVQLADNSGTFSINQSSVRSVDPDFDPGEPGVRPEPALVGEFPASGGPITLATTNGPIQANGLDIQTPAAGVLSNGSNPAPWAFYITGNNGVGKTQVTLGSLGAAATLDGSLTIDVSASADALVEATWGNGTTPEPFPVNGNWPDTSTNPGDIERVPTIKGAYPFGGGAVTIDSGATPDQIGRLQIEATQGALQSGGNPTPFETVSSSTSRFWVASSKSEVTLDGQATLDVTATADSALRGVATNSFGNGNVIVKEGPTDPPVLTGSFPFSGGPVTVSPIEGTVALRGIDINARIGSISSDGSAAPFAELAENTNKNWKARSTQNVVIDGSVTLDLRADPESQLLGISIQEGDSLAEIPIRRRSNPGAALAGSFPDGGGAITIAPRNGDSVALRGVGFTSPRNELSGGGSSAPFDSLDVNTTENWAASSASDVVLDGQVTLDVIARDNANVQGTMQTADEAGTFSVNEALVRSVNPNGPNFDAELVGEFPFEEGGPITITTTKGPINVGGLDFISTGPDLSNGSNPAPWSFYITGNDGSGLTQVALGTLGSSPTIDGSLTLDVSAAAGADVRATWGKGTTPVPFPINGKGGGDGEFSFVPSIQGTVPFGGGALTIDSGAEPDQIGRLQIQATEGTIEGGNNAAPFDRITTNTDKFWVATSTSEITLDGQVTLDVSASRSTTVTGVATNSFGSGRVNFQVGESDPPVLTGSIPFEGGPITVSPVDSSASLLGLNIRANTGSLTSGGSPAPFSELLTNTDNDWSVQSNQSVVIDGSVTLDVTPSNGAQLSGLAIQDDSVTELPIAKLGNPGARIRGSYPEAGGPITISPSTNGDSVALRGIGIAASRGSLTGGGNAAPFASLDANTTEQWSASSTTDVTLDGEVTLDVSASADSRLDGRVQIANNAGPFSVRVKREIPDDVKLVGEYPSGGGAITIETTQGPIQTRGLDFKAVAGSITGGDNPAPFHFFLHGGDSPFAGENTNQVTLGVLGGTVTLDGAVTLDVTASSDALVDAYWGDGLDPRPFPINGNIARELDVLPQVTASFPFAGGPITIDSGDTPDPVDAISLSAWRGSLSSGGNPAPFETLTENTDEAWAARSSSAIVLDGQVTLDVEASIDARIAGSVTNVERTFGFGVSRQAATQPQVLKGSYPFGGGPIDIEPSGDGPATVRGLAVTSRTERLTSGGSAAPFDELTTSTSGAWVAASEADVVIDGRVTLDLSVLRGELEAASKDENGWAPLPITERNSFSVAARRPFDGGPITLSGGAEISRLELNAEQGSLSSGGIVAPFESLEANTSEQWIALASSSLVRLDGELTLDVSASADSVVTGILTNDFADQKAFSVSRDSPGFRDSLFGRYPSNGGSVTLVSAEGPTRLRSLSISATRGAVIGGETAAPFESVVESTRESYRVASTSDVTIDGEVTLDVTVEANSRLTGRASDGNETFDFAMRQIFDGGDFNLGDFGISDDFLNSLDSELVIFLTPQRQLLLVPTDGPIVAGGIDIHANGAFLSNGSDAGPWSFFITGNDADRTEQVTLGSLGSAPTISGPTLIDVFSDTTTLSATWGDGTTPVALPVIPLGVVPEPNGNILVLLAVSLVLPIVRRRRVARISSKASC